MKNPLIIFVVLLNTGVILAQERILDFKSNITINNDRSVTVVENIKVQTGDNFYRDGIIRVITDVLTGERGEKIYCTLTVNEVLRDGQPAAYDVYDDSFNKQIGVRPEDSYLDPGVYDYTLSYTLTEQVQVIGNRGIFIWDVTGFSWETSIDQAEAEVTIPDGSGFLSYEVWDREIGNTGNFETKEVDQRTVRVSTTRPLGPYESISFNINVQRGDILAMTKGEIMKIWYDNFKGIVYGTAGTFLMCLLIFVGWWTAGRGAKKTDLGLVYHPPGKISPAVAGYLRFMGYKITNMAAAIVNLAIKGRYVLDLSRDKFVLNHTSNETSKVSPEEQKMYKGLYPEKDPEKGLYSGVEIHYTSLLFSEDHYNKIKKGQDGLYEELERKYKTGYFSKNQVWLFPAVILLFITVSVTVWGTGDSVMFLYSVFGMFVMVFIAVLLLIRIFRSSDSRGMEYRVAPMYTMTAILLLLCFVPSVIMTLMEGFYLFRFVILLGCFLIFIINFLLCFLFAWKLEAYSTKGREIMDQLDGLRAYMEAIVNEEELPKDAPELTPKLFEKLLPYYISLGLATKWGNRFEIVFLNSPGLKKYNPSWFKGGRKNLENISVRAMGAML